MVMSTVDLEKYKHTVSDAAERFGKSSGRIRQLCLQHAIGKLVAGKIRLLSDYDLKKLGKIFDKIGRNFAPRTKS